MTDPQPLSEVDLLVWAVVLGYRARQQRAGLRFVLMPFPPCPSCGETVHSVNQVEREVGITRTTCLTMQPCGHAHTTTDDDVYPLLRHIDDLIDRVERDDRSRDPDVHGWMVDDIVREARTRLAPPEPLDGPESAQEAPGGGAGGRGGEGAEADSGSLGPREAAYNVVYAYLRSTNRMPGDLGYRNAMIWRAVHAALDAAGVPAASPAPAVRDLAAQLLARGREYRQLPSRDFEAEGVQEKLSAILEASWRFAEAAGLPREYDLAQIRDAAVEMTAEPIDGLSVREAAADDNAHWNTKYAGEQT